MATEQSVKIASFLWSWAISGVNKKELSPVQPWAGRPAWVILTRRLIGCEVGMIAGVCLQPQEFQWGHRGRYPGVLMRVPISLWVGKPEQGDWVWGVFFLFHFAFKSEKKKSNFQFNYIINIHRVIIKSSGLTYCLPLYSNVLDSKRTLIFRDREVKGSPGRELDMDPACTLSYLGVTEAVSYILGWQDLANENTDAQSNLTFR